MHRGSVATGTHLYCAPDCDMASLREFSGKPATKVGCAIRPQIVAWTLAIGQRLNIRSFAEIVMPYPTYSEIGKRAAITFFTPRLTRPWVRRILRLLRGFG